MYLTYQTEATTKFELQSSTTRLADWDHQLALASIIITGTGEDKQFSVTTNQFGSYGSQVSLGPGTHIVKAHFAGDSEHR